MKSFQRVFALVCVLLIMPFRAYAEDPPLRFDAPTHVAVQGPGDGSVFLLPPGYFFSDAQFGKLDVEVRRLQTAETRLLAERESYTQAAKASPPTSRVVLVCVLAFIGGAALASAATYAASR